MARAAIGWGVRELAEKAGITANTVTRIENGADAKQSTIEALQRALSEAGVEFIPENGGGVGVRLRKAAGESAAAGRTPPSGPSKKTKQRTPAGRRKGR
jgi:transcriptional regulator with XRE-family HTH domain